MRAIAILLALQLAACATVPPPPDSFGPHYEDGPASR